MCMRKEPQLFSSTHAKHFRRFCTSCSFCHKRTCWGSGLKVVLWSPQGRSVFNQRFHSVCLFPVADGPFTTSFNCLGSLPNAHRKAKHAQSSADDLSSILLIPKREKERKDEKWERISSHVCFLSSVKTPVSHSNTQVMNAPRWENQNRIR